MAAKHRHDFRNIERPREYIALLDQQTPKSPQKQEEYGFSTSLPPILKIEEISFSEKVLDATETAQLSLTLRNFGAGDADKVYVQLSSTMVELEFPFKTPVPLIHGNGGSATVNIDVSSSHNLPSSEALLTIEVVDPEFKVTIPGKQLSIPTREYRRPELILAKFAVVENLSANPNNQIDLNEQIDVKFAIQNVGQGAAEEVQIEVSNHQNGVMLLGVIDEQGRLIRKNPDFESIPVGKYQTMSFRYFVNSEFSEQDLRFEIQAREKSGHYGLSEFKGGGHQYRTERRRLYPPSRGTGRLSIRGCAHRRYSRSGGRYSRRYPGGLFQQKQRLRPCFWK